MDRSRHLRQQRQHGGSAVPAKELARPAVDAARRIGVAALDRAQKVGHVVAAVGEGEGRPRRRDRLVGVGHERRRVVLQHDLALETEHVGAAVEPGDADAVAEDVVHIAQHHRLRRDHELRRQHPLIVALLRPHHHAMLADRDRLAVAIGGDVTDLENRHGVEPKALRPQSFMNVAKIDAPEPAIVHRAGSNAAFVVICDHAGRAVPPALGDMGLPSSELERHIAWDIGAGALSLQLGETFQACTILQRYSRLVIDCNRAPGTPGSIPELSDGTIVPANLGLDAGSVAARVAAIPPALSRGHHARARPPRHGREGARAGLGPQFHAEAARRRR